MFFLVLSFAAIGGWIALKFKIPAGALIGAMAAVTLLNLVLNSEILFPAQVKFLTQAMTGSYIGSKIERSDLISLRGIALPAIILSVTMLVFNLLISLVLCACTELNLETALFATAPAGITDMTLAAMDFNADAPKVAVLQTVRLLSVLSIMPWIVKWIGRKGTSASSAPVQKSESSTPKEKTSIKEITSTVLIGLTFGGAGYLIGVPAGTISFAMFGCATYNIGYHKAYIPLRLRQYIQFVAGALIGGMITRTQMLKMLEMLPVLLIVIIGFLILNLTSGVLLYKLGKMDPVTSLLASSAGGLTDMAIIAEEMGADSTKVATMQLIRVVSVIAFYPAIIDRILQMA